MTDSALLELAAKAAGIDLTWDVAGRVCWLKSCRTVWNPLMDNGDALRLAVDLRIHISPTPDYIEARYFDGAAWQCFREHGNHAAATRRAIVRAAAAMAPEAA